MTKLQDILDPLALSEMVSAKRINVQFHPTLPLRIYNYSNIAQFAGQWTNEERVCRGLIVDEDDNIVARGPSKFFNYGQSGAPEVAMDDWVHVTRKEDGSLGIGWRYGDEYGVATRGSFTSDQALHATNMLTEDDKSNIFWANFRECTRIWEVVYPENRIVLSYDGRDELIPIGTVKNISGLIAFRPPTVLVEKYEMTFADALALPIPDDEEGYVLDVMSTEGPTRGHIKLKGENYIRLHGAIFGLSERKIWEVFGEQLKNEESNVMEEFISGLPDELQPWANKVWERLERDFREQFSNIELGHVFLYLRFGEDYQKKENRKDVALFINECYPELKGPMFSGLDERWDAVEDWAYKQIKPAHKLFRTESEDSN